MGKKTVMILTAALCVGCANHPVDCGMGIYHADCLPGTAGYADPNRFTPEDASEDLELPLEVIQEALAYYEAHKALIQREAAEERRFLAEKGYPLEPKDLSR